MFPVRGWEVNLRKDDRLFWIARPSEHLFQGVRHRWWPTEKEDGLWAGRRKMLAKDISSDSPSFPCPSRRRLFQDMNTVEVRMRFGHPVPTRLEK